MRERDGRLRFVTHLFALSLPPPFFFSFSSSPCFLSLPPPFFFSLPPPFFFLFLRLFSFSSSAFFLSLPPPFFFLFPPFFFFFPFLPLFLSSHLFFLFSFSFWFLFFHPPPLPRLFIIYTLPPVPKSPRLEVWRWRIAARSRWYSSSMDKTANELPMVDVMLVTAPAVLYRGV